MARWPSLLAAAALLAAPSALLAQTEAKPQAASDPVVEPARVIAAMDVCRRAPSRAGALGYAREQGFGDLPPEIRSRIPVETLVRDNVRLRAEASVSIEDGGSCTVYATVAETHSLDELAATLNAQFGQSGEQDDRTRIHWRIDGRYIAVSLRGDYLEIFVSFPDLTPAQVAEARAARDAADAEVMATLTAASAPSSAADIAAAAVLCATPTGARADALTAAGWSAQGGRFRRAGSNVAILGFGAQCIVDAYGDRADAFDRIRDAIRDALVTRFGRGNVRLASSMGNAGSFSRGQGFMIDGRIGVLSSEQRPNGLSIRFTVMAID
jgi:hypothetical protein